VDENLKVNLEAVVLVIENMTPIENVTSAETKRELIAAINALAEPDREIIVRRYYYQQKPKEIGYILDLSVKQVENRLYKSKLKLRGIMSR
jgi:RNA polymerase sigma-70 factor (ECF subfamily)